MLGMSPAHQGGTSWRMAATVDPVQTSSRPGRAHPHENINPLVWRPSPTHPARHQGHQPVPGAEVPYPADGSVGQRNGIPVHRLEHKDGAEGVRPPARSRSTTRKPGCRHGPQGHAGHVHDDERERLGVGIQGLGIASAAYQSAVAYARDRCRAARCPAPSGHLAADPIIVTLPDVRRMLSCAQRRGLPARSASGWAGGGSVQARRHRGRTHRGRRFRGADDAGW